ncbi:Flagellar M-ring protein FliF [hydrothermal vent metagenome]|uniref:Flagellar M-ring protein FliF n=1 Tax=hydrothermal vent metagenome TaxID=652676 RepID=A0A3B0S7F0_9ZZZZ
MDSFFQTLSRLGPMRLVAILGITAGITIALVLMAAGMGRAEKALLYSQLNLKEAGEITARLDQMNVGYEIRSGGSAIFVERDKVEMAKMSLAAENLPSSGSFGYDIFDQAGSMGQTTFTQNINKLRALQGELERTISTIDGVDAAKVLLVLPERQLFQTKTEKAKASVTIKLGVSSIGSRQTNAIRHLVAAAVPGLTTQGVTVVDDTGRVLAESENGVDDAIDGQDRTSSVEQALANKVKQVLTSIVGVHGVEVQVNAELDLNRITEIATIYDPDGQVIISSDTNEQLSDEKDAEQDNPVTVGDNVPGSSVSGAGEGGSSLSSSTTSETINFGNSKTETTRIYQSGAITRLSVAVNVDGITGVDEEGKITWVPRSAEEMTQIENLVKSSIGYSAARKDQLQVTNLRFFRPTPLDVDAKAKKPGFDKNDIMRLIELVILAVVSIVMIFFLARPLLAALMGGGGSFVVGAKPALAGAGAGMGAMPQLPGMAAPDGQMALPAPDGTMPVLEEENIDISKIEGQVKASSVKQVAGIVDSHPEESMAILRTWLHEG